MVAAAMRALNLMASKTSSGHSSEGAPTLEQRTDAEHSRATPTVGAVIISETPGTIGSSTVLWTMTLITLLRQLSHT